jgi:archaellum biogenesis protein FlaJ (TadC family)
MNVQHLSRGEWIAMVGGLILGISVFMPWYGHEGPNGSLGDRTGGDYTLSAWDVHTILRFLLIAAAAAPFILAWIIIREHELSWPRGQVTSVVAIAALGLILYQGVISRPGEPKSAISLEWGWFLALVGAGLMLVGSVIRQAETEVKRKPPGTL